MLPDPTGSFAPGDGARALRLVAWVCAERGAPAEAVRELAADLGAQLGVAAEDVEELVSEGLAGRRRELPRSTAGLLGLFQALTMISRTEDDPVGLEGGVATLAALGVPEETAVELGMVFVEMMRARAPGGGAPARRRHYDFAHRMLPQLLFADPARFVAEILEPDDRAVRVASLWEALGRRLAEAGGEAGPTMDEPQTSERPLSDGTRAWLIRFAAPEQVPEAAFALVLADFRGRPHYFVLEFGRTPDGRTAWFLCDWAPDDGRELSHRNYGPCDPEMPIEPAAFQRAVETLLAN